MKFLKNNCLQFVSYFFFFTSSFTVLVSVLFLTFSFFLFLEDSNVGIQFLYNLIAVLKSLSANYSLEFFLVFFWSFFQFYVVGFTPFKQLFFNLLEILFTANSEDYDFEKMTLAELQKRTKIALVLTIVSVLLIVSSKYGMFHAFCMGIETTTMGLKMLDYLNRQGEERNEDRGGDDPKKPHNSGFTNAHYLSFEEFHIFQILLQLIREYYSKTNNVHEKIILKSLLDLLKNISTGSPLELSIQLEKIYQVINILNNSAPKNKNSEKNLEKLIAYLIFLINGGYNSFLPKTSETIDDNVSSILRENNNPLPPRNYSDIEKFLIEKGFVEALQVGFPPKNKGATLGRSTERFRDILKFLKRLFKK